MRYGQHPYYLPPRQAARQRWDDEIDALVRNGRPRMGRRVLPCGTVQEYRL